MATATRDLEDHRKRQIVFTMKPETVLVKITTDDFPIQGLDIKIRDEKAVNQKHREASEAMGLKKAPYRSAVDTGFPVIQNAADTATTHLLADLETAGFIYTGGHYFKKGSPRNENYINVLQFSLQGEKKPLPKSARDILSGARFDNAHIWANRLTDNNGGGKRLDTINLLFPHTGDKGKREIRVNGNTYKLV